MAEVKIKDIAKSLVKGDIKTRFGKEASEGNELIRRAIMKEAGMGAEWDMYLFQQNRHMVFRLLSELLTETIAEQNVLQYESWVDFGQVAFGDTIEFKVPNDELFNVGIVADGVNNIRRQRILNKKLKMTSFQLGTKIYSEFDDFRLGRIDFADLVNRVAKSIDKTIMDIVVRQIEQAYNGLDSKYVVKGTYDDDKLLGICTAVEARTGLDVAIYGTKKALSNLRKSSSANWAEADKVDIRQQGFVGMFNGIPCIEIAQSMDKAQNFVVSDTMLHVIPNGTKIVKILQEGTADVLEDTQMGTRDDQQIEYSFVQRYQIATVKSNVYGAYVIQTA